MSKTKAEILCENDRLRRSLYKVTRRYIIAYIDSIAARKALVTIDKLCREKPDISVSRILEIIEPIINEGMRDNGWKSTRIT